MSVNSSYVADLSLPSPALTSSNVSLHPLNNTCFTSKTSIFVFYAFTITNILILPLFILALYLGYQQRRQQRFMSTTASSHSDLFIYNSIAMQLIVFLGLTSFFCGGYVHIPEMMQGGLYIWSIIALGQAMFHILTCVERYLAVVHPITYLHLRQASGVRIRNISIACVWFLTFGWLPVCFLTTSMLNMILYCSCMAVFLIVSSFCSISVLCVLRRPGPGEVGGNKELRVDQSKQRAFHTIVTMMGVLFCRFGGNLIGNVIYNSAMVNPGNYCVVLLFIYWIDLPSSLVLPLLFLNRIGKLQCCTQMTES